MDQILNYVMGNITIISIGAFGMLINLLWFIKHTKGKVPPEVMDIFDLALTVMTSVAVGLIFYWGVTWLTDTAEIRFAGLLFGAILGNRVLSIFSDTFLQKIADKVSKTKDNDNSRYRYPQQQQQPQRRPNNRRRVNNRRDVDEDTPPDNWFENED